LRKINEIPGFGGGFFRVGCEKTWVLERNCPR